MALALASYRPRHARESPLYALVLDHHERLARDWEARWEPRYGPWRACVGTALLRYLDCGVLANGFLRVVCQNGDSRHEVLVPWTCKRTICPSCGQRRSLEFSQFVDSEVWEEAPIRHVVLTRCRKSCVRRSCATQVRPRRGAS